MNPGDGPWHTVHLVTHAEAQHNVDGVVGGWFDSDLTRRGERQAKQIADALAGRVGAGSVSVHSSDLRRAHRTAAPVAERLDVEVRLDARLRERCFGEAEGRPVSWAQGHVIPLNAGASLLDHDDGPAGTETRRHLVERLRSALSEILVDPAEHQVVVSHGAATSHLMMALLGVPVFAADKGFFKLAKGSITTFQYSPGHGSYTAVAVNDTSHLACSVVD